MSKPTKDTPAYLVAHDADYVDRESITWWLRELRLTWDDVPTIPDLDQKILAGILANPELYDQETFACRTHCGTAMCRAGWAVAVSGSDSLQRTCQKYQSGYTYLAGALYAKAYPDRPIPYFGTGGDGPMHKASIQDIVYWGLAGLVQSGG